MTNHIGRRTVDFTCRCFLHPGMRSAASPPVDELEERRPLTEAARSPFALPPSDSPWQRARERLRRNLGLDRNGANVLDQNLLSSIGAAIRAQVSATPMAAGGNEGTAGAPTAADADADADAAAPLGALPESVPRGDILAAARWVEDAMPFAMLLLVVFLYRHLVSILTFFWLTSLLHNANERMRHAAHRSNTWRALHRPSASLTLSRSALHTAQAPDAPQGQSLAPRAPRSRCPPMRVGCMHRSAPGSALAVTAAAASH